jgi:hypothetical protein
VVEGPGFVTSTKRRYQNATEQAFQEHMRAEGWLLTKRGWPDFLAYQDGGFIAVEVKPDNERHHVKTEQRMVLSWLAAHGIGAYVWTPSGGFEEVEPMEPTR